MSKIISLKCGGCGETLSFREGAGHDLETLQDILVRINDERESDKILELMMSVSGDKGSDKVSVFFINLAEGLTNTDFDACGETVHLFDPKDLADVNRRLFTPDLNARIANSRQKWVDALAGEGVVAFEAIYCCKKCRRLQKGMFLRIRAGEDKKCVFYQLPNRCEKCNNPLTLVDDDNMGFLFEGVPTVFSCEKCGGRLIASTTVFNK